jgi:hypothetical protein
MYSTIIINKELMQDEVMETNNKNKNNKNKRKAAEKAGVVMKKSKKEKKTGPKKACSAYAYFSKEMFPVVKAEQPSLKFTGKQ